MRCSQSDGAIKTDGFFLNYTAPAGESLLLLSLQG